MARWLGIASSGIAGSLMLCGVAWALPDRSALSFDENATINYACNYALRQGNDAFQRCVENQLAQMQEHPSPDRSGLPLRRARGIERACAYLRNVGIGKYNDCVKEAMAAPDRSDDKAADDALISNFAKVFTTDAAADSDKPKLVPVVAKSLPRPAEALPKLPERVSDKPIAPAAVFKKVQASVFIVLATQSMADARAASFAQGSAVAVSDHLLLTNCHVVKDRPVIKIFQEGKSADATLAAADMTSDRCVLKTEDMALTPITGVRPVGTLGIGERLFAIGAPIGVEHTMSEGLLSGLRKAGSLTLVQTSAAISHGSSGGGLFDERGNLVGITTLGFFTVAENLNFAIAAADFWQ